MFGAMSRTLHAALATLALSSVLPAGLAAQNPEGIVTGAAAAYSLQPGDILQIRVWGREEFSGQFQVDETGMIQYPVLGELNTSGLTVMQVRERIRTELETLFRSPFVTVTPLFRMAVLGEVVRPGLYTADPTLSVTDIVAMAGGPTPSGNMRKINLLRSGEKIIFDFEQEALAGRTLSEIGVRSGDEIIIPRKFFTRQDLLVIVALAQVGLSIAIFVNTVN
jgi:polysaccharide export outer membrane protein